MTSTTRRFGRTRRTGAVAGAVAMLATGLVVAGPAAPSTATASAAAPTASTTVLTPIAITSPRLPRRPPTLTRPITIKVTNQMGDLRLSTSRDYRIVLPTNRAWKNSKGLSIAGGHNVVVIGGTVDIGYGYRDSQGDLVKRAAYIRKSTGVVHIEGVRFLSSTTKKLNEGIDVSLPGGSLRLFNVWISSMLTGTHDTNHADALQTWAGPRYLFVDGFTATTQYQGMFLTPSQHSSAPVTLYDLRRVWLRGLQSGYLLWRQRDLAVRTSEVYISGYKRQLTGLWPGPSGWPYVKRQVPSTRFGTTAGAGYRSPGYL